MIYGIKHIARLVRLAMGRNPTKSPLADIADDDMLTIERVVAARADEAARRAIAMASATDLAGSGHDFADEGVYMHPPCDGLYSGHVLLPADFMRLVCFRMSDWSAPVFTPVDIGSASYALQRASFAALRGVPQRPVCALVPMPEGLALEFHSCRSAQATIAVASYIPAPRLHDGIIDIPEPCFGAFIDVLLSFVTNPPKINNYV